LSRGEVYLCAPFGASGVGSVTGDKHPFYLMRVMTWTMLPQAKREPCCLPIDRAFAYRLLPVVPGWSIDETISGERLSRVSEWLRLSWREEKSSIYRTSIGNIQVHVRMQCTGEDDMYTIAQGATNLDAVHAWMQFESNSRQQTSRQADKQTSRQADKQTSRQADKQTSRQADKQAVPCRRQDSSLSGGSSSPVSPRCSAADATSASTPARGGTGGLQWC
jgi:hypothetical protein